MIDRLLQKLYVAAAAAFVSATPVADAQLLAAKVTANVADLKPPIVSAMPALKDAWRVCEAGAPYITSGNDSVHRVGSWHGKSLAVDLRSRGLSVKQIRCLLDEVPKHLPKTDDGRYVFIFEPTNDKVTEHFHFHFAAAVAA